MRRLKQNINLIAVLVIGGLISGQDLFLFSIVGPEVDLRTGPEGIRDAQVFSNQRNAMTTIITHGMLIGIIFLLLIRPVNNVYLPPGTPDKETDLK